MEDYVKIEDDGAIDAYLDLATYGDIDRPEDLGEDESQPIYDDAAALHYIAGVIPKFEKFTFPSTPPRDVDSVRSRVVRVRDLLDNLPEGNIPLTAKTGGGTTEQFIDKVSERYEKVKEFINPEYQSKMEKLIQKLKGSLEVTPELVESEPVSISDINQHFQYFSSSSTVDRERIYDFWTEANDFFQDPPKDLDINLEGTDYIIEGVGDEVENVARLFRRIELPNYVMNLTSIDIKQYKDEVISEAILNNVFPRDKYSNYRYILSGGKADYGARMSIVESRGRADFNPQGEMGVEEFTTPYSDIEEYFKRTKQIKFVDPLLAIESQTTDNNFFIDTPMEEKIIKQLSELYNVESAPYLANILNIAIDKVKEIIQAMKTDIINRKVFNLPIMDDNVHRGIFQRSITENLSLEVLTFETSVENGDLRLIPKYRDIQVSSYNDFVDKVNQKATNAFKLLAQILPDSKFKPFASGQDKGGTATLPSKGIEPSIKRSFAESHLADFIKVFYFDFMNFRYFYGKDTPQFTDSEEYTTLQQSLSSISGRFYEGMLRRLTVAPGLLENDDIKNLTRFFKGAQRGTTRSPIQIVNDTSKLYLSLVQIVALADEPISETRKMNTSLKNFLGAVLFTEMPEQGELTFEGKKLSQYKDIPSDGLIKELLDDIVLLTKDRDFAAYARQNNMKDIGKLTNAIKRSRYYRDGLIKSGLTNAYLDALDTLRKSRNLPVYRAHLYTDDIEDVDEVISIIKNEDGIDMYMTDIEKIIQSGDSFNTIAKSHGIDTLVVYKIKGLFR